MPTVYLIDGSAYVHRAYHAIRSGLSTATGLPTNATFGFTKILVRLLEERHPDYVAVAFDRKGPTFRHEMFAEYKANRPPMPEELAAQLPYIESVIDGFRIPILGEAGFEADDLIGTLARQCEDSGFHVVMVTGDKDFLQLVTEKVALWDPMRDKTMDLAAIRKEFDLAPEQLIDAMGLAGDTSDNVPGVPGIGMKTAVKLIGRYGTMENLYGHLDDLPGKKQRENLIQYRDQAFLSRDLVTIRTDAPVAFDPDRLKRREPDAARLAAIFNELEFRQFQKDFAETTERPESRYAAVTDQETFDTLLSRMAAAEWVAIDTETTSQDPMRAQLVGLSIALVPHEAFYIPLAHKDPNLPDQLSMKTVLGGLKPMLENKNLRKIGQNIKYDWIVLARHGIHLDGVAFDTMVASYLIDPAKRSHSLDQIARDLLGEETTTYADVAGKGRQMVLFDQVPLEKAMPYACEDADVTLRAAGVLRAELSKVTGLTALLDTVEMPLVPVLKDMEMAGVAVDQGRLRELSKSFAHQLEGIEKDIYALAAEEFNIKSSQQLGRILFEKLDLPVQKKTKKRTGYSTDVEVLTALAAFHELPGLILRHRTLAKLKSTYADALLELIHPETGRIHTSFNQTVTATGRLSSSEPNLQNIPIRTDEGMEIRRTFIPRNGWRLMAADYSQVELRLLAHYSEDDTLIRAFRENEDIHTRTAAEVFQMSPETVTPELRRQAKTINFGIIYGMGPFSLSKELGISQKMADTYIRHYFSRYPGVKRFVDTVIAEARQTRMTTTLLGRIRRLPEIDSSNRNVRGFAERTAVNTPIQGTAADLIKLAMIRVHERIRAEKKTSVMLLTVHDELVFEVPENEIEEMKTLVTEIMENVLPDLRVPLTVNIGVGDNWAEAH